MWHGMSGPLPSAPGRDPADLDARVAEQPPGPPPWAPRERLTPVTGGFLALVALGVAGAVVSLGVAAWRLLDHASDLR